MRLRFAGDDRWMRGKTTLDCLRDHCRGDHSAAGLRGDVDGVMARIAETFKLDAGYAALPTLEGRCDAFVMVALEQGLLLDANVES